MSVTSSLTHTCEKIEVDWTIFGGYNTLQGKKKKRGRDMEREMEKEWGEKKKIKTVFQIAIFVRSHFPITCLEYLGVFIKSS